MGKGARGRDRKQRERQPRLGAHGTGDDAGPIIEAWVLDGSPGELVALERADTPEGLQRVLVIPGRSRDTRCDDAVDAFRCAYDGHDDAGLVESVALACTQPRWKGVARPLLEGLVGGGMLGEGHVGLLADVFLHNNKVAVTAPGAWLVDFYLQQRHGEPRRLDPAKTYTLWRPLGLQLRRWAARESVGDRGGIGPVLARARELDSRHGAAVALGLVDATDRLDDATAAEVVDLGLDWPDPSVRLPALKRLAAAGRDDEAVDRAEGDRAAHIRRWAATHRQRTLPSPLSGASQPSLFA